MSNKSKKEKDAYNFKVSCTAFAITFLVMFVGILRIGFGLDIYVFLISIAIAAVASLIALLVLGDNAFNPWDLRR